MNTAAPLLHAPSNIGFALLLVVVAVVFLFVGAPLAAHGPRKGKRWGWGLLVGCLVTAVALVFLMLHETATIDAHQTEVQEWLETEHDLTVPADDVSTLLGGGTAPADYDGRYVTVSFGETPDGHIAVYGPDGKPFPGN